MIALLTLLWAQTPPYRVAIIDSYFCPQKFYAGHNLRTQYPLGKRSKDCSMSSKAFHGHRLLMEVTRNLRNPSRFEFYLINVFEADGKQNPKTWKQAVEFVNKNAMDLVITASGYFADTSLQDLVLKPPLLAAAGNAVGPLAHRPQLFPQSSASPQKYLVGAFIPIPGPTPLQAWPDSLNMHPQQINLFMPGQKKRPGPSGSSLAVALAARFYLNSCAPKSIEICLRERGVILGLCSLNKSVDKRKTAKPLKCNKQAPTFPLPQ